METKGVAKRVNLVVLIGARIIIIFNVILDSQRNPADPHAEQLRQFKGTYKCSKSLDNSKISLSLSSEPAP